MLFARVCFLTMFLNPPHFVDSRGFCNCVLVSRGSRSFWLRSVRCVFAPGLEHAPRCLGPLAFGPLVGPKSPCNCVSKRFCMFQKILRSDGGVFSRCHECSLHC